MSRFSFRLQRVLDLKEKVEQEKASELARAQAQSDQAQEALAALAAVRAAGAQQLAAAHGSHLTVGQLQNLGFVLGQIDAQVTRASDDADSAASAVRGAQAELTTALQQRRVLDRLRERQLDQWQHAESHADLQAMDDLALTRFTKQTPQATDDV